MQNLWELRALFPGSLSWSYTQTQYINQTQYITFADWKTMCELVLISFLPRLCKKLLWMLIILPILNENTNTKSANKSGIVYIAAT